MKNIFKNISLKVVIITGFVSVIFIFAGIGITQYNALNKIEDLRASRNIFSNAKYKFQDIRFLITDDIRLVNKLKLVDSEEEVNKIVNQHEIIVSQFNTIFEEIDLSYDFIIIEEERIFIQQLRDSLGRYNTLYNTGLRISFLEIAKKQRLLNNPSQIRKDRLELLLEQSELKKNYDQFRFNYNSPESMDKVVDDLIREYIKEIKNHTIQVERDFNRLKYSITKLNVGFEKILTSENVELTRISKISINVSWIIFLIGLITSSLIGYGISKMLISPIEELGSLTQRLSKGELPAHDFDIANNELGEMNSAIKDLLDGLKLTSKFASEIGKGNFEHEYTPLGKKDVLGNSLLNMRKSLQTAQKEEQKRQVEDQMRGWSTEGLAKFAEILRHHPDNLRGLSDEIICELVKYINANQGGIFILNDMDKNDIYLELLASYAYNRKKHLNKKIKIGEGLVGAVALEKFTIYMTDVPDEYIEIESGTGSANPNSILIVPLKIENDVLGIIELASFYKFQKHERLLVERIAESIASTLATARINTQTAQLLEKSQIQANEMKLQEEEMKATIEQLQQIQEDSIINEEYLKIELEKNKYENAEISEKNEKDSILLKKLKKENSEIIQLNLERQKYNRNIFNSLMSGIILINDIGTIDFFSNEAENIWILKESEVVGRNIKTLVDLPKNFKTITQYVKENKDNLDDHGAIKYEITRKDKIKKKYFFKILINDIQSEENRFIVFVRDIHLFAQNNKKEAISKLGLKAKEFEQLLKIEFLEDKLLENDIFLEDDFMPNQIIEWKPAYSIGLNIIDGQHQKWISLINGLYGAIKEGRNNSAIEKVFKELIEYTEYHFGFEEKYMTDTKYESFESHKKIHTDFTEKIKEYFSNYKNGQNDATYSLLLYLRSWVETHITVHDKSYVEAFKSHGLS